MSEEACEDTCERMDCRIRGCLGGFTPTQTYSDRISELESAIKEMISAWDWWQVDTYDRCSTVPGDAIEDLRKLVGG